MEQPKHAPRQRESKHPYGNVYICYKMADYRTDYWLQVNTGVNHFPVGLG